VIITKSAELATQALSNGAATLLNMCIQHHELSLKNVAAMALSDLASHSSKHAQAICNAGGLVHLSRTLNIFDSKLKVSLYVQLVFLPSISLFPHSITV
jgi:hypothetical protein